MSEIIGTDAKTTLLIETESKGKIRCAYTISFADGDLKWVTSLPVSDGESVLQLQTRLVEKLLQHLHQCGLNSAPEQKDSES